MAFSTVLSVAQTILTAIQTLHQLKDSFSFSHYENELERLHKTVNAIQSVLEDADAKRGALNSQQTHYIEELKDVVYDASDVIDEFVILVKRKELNESSLKFSHKVKAFDAHMSKRDSSFYLVKCDLGAGLELYMNFVTMSTNLYKKALHIHDGSVSEESNMTRFSNQGLQAITKHGCTDSKMDVD